MKLIFTRPAYGSIQWDDFVALFRELGGEVKEREGSRADVCLFDEVRVYHRPHPGPDTDKGAVANDRKWFERHGLKP